MVKDWDGNDRRRHAPIDIRIDDLEKKIVCMEKTLKDMNDAWMQMQGVIKFFKLCFFICGPIVAFVYWWRDHVKF